MKRTSLVDTLANEFVFGQTHDQPPQQKQELPSKLEQEVQKIPLSKVHLSPLQYRRYVDQAKLAEMVSSIQKYGQLQPVLVRPDPKTSGYELVFGQTRFLSCQKAGTGTILSKIQELTDAEVVELALIENNHRTNPNPVEETQGMLKLLSLKLGKTDAEVVTLLNRAATEGKQGSDNVIRSDEWKVIKSVFELFSGLTPESFRVNRLPLLNLPEDVLTALSQGKIEYTKARAIARLKDTQNREDLLQTAIEQDLSLSQIRERVAEPKTNTHREVTQPTLQERVDSVYKRLKKNKIWNDPSKGKKLEKMLLQLEALLSEDL
ncbi:MAG: ParB/RepB/Spo0J family partition protein [Oculatellaceae cyanobacterium Prado106]|jgi:ParB family chromosome partitioning protein|nr:ParB/RepB/Spo0J family partition protein [Oculatellaceae cyanobacterium Prado106]